VDGAKALDRAFCVRIDCPDGGLAGGCVNKSTAALYFHRLREIIFQESEDASPLFGEVEVDESYFGGHRKSKRGRGAGGKVPVFGLLKHGGKVYAKVIPDAKGKTLKAIIETKVVPDSIVYSDTLAPTTYPMCPTSSTAASTIPRCSRTRRTTSTESRTSVTRPSVTCVDSTVYRQPTSTSL
jgi:hypothetical protein